MKKSFQEQEKGLLFEDETGNAFCANLRNSYWVCEWPSWLEHDSASTRQGPPLTTRNNSIYLAPPKQETDSKSAGYFSQSNKPSLQRLDQNLQNSNPSNSPKTNFINNNNVPLTLVSIDPLGQSSSQSQSSSDDEGDGQEDESDSTDESDTSPNSPIKQRCEKNSTTSDQTQEEIIVDSRNKNAEDDESDEVLIHEWPEGRPLPYPMWNHRTPEAVYFEDILQYEHFVGMVEFVSQRTVANHKYNTVDNFIRYDFLHLKNICHLKMIVLYAKIYLLILLDSTGHLKNQRLTHWKISIVSTFPI